MRSRPSLRLAATALAAIITTAAFAQDLPRRDVVDVPAIGDGLCLSNVFQSHMVLQRDAPIELWGWAEPGADVAVRFADARATTTAGEDRAWRVTLPPQPADAEPRALTVQSGDMALLLEDVLVGDVWVLGGQSNMEFELAKVENGALEIAGAHDDGLRLLTVPYGRDGAERSSFDRGHQWSDWFGRHFRKGDWDVCSPAIARDFSAIGYRFATRLRAATGVPIGVIDASRGGTTVESWTPRAALRALDSEEVRGKLAEWDARVEDYDAAADLERRTHEHAERIARFAAEGRTVPEDERDPPTDLRPGPIADTNHPGNSFAAMLGPLGGLRVKGVLFHQGYNNALDGMRGVRLYEDVFPVMIAEWRAHFGDPGLPFAILSLPTDGEPQTGENYVERMFDAGVELRAVQYATFLDLWDAGDRTIGFASCYDLRRAWYHPQLKLPAGDRLARWALAAVYDLGRGLHWKPPAILDVEARDGALVVHFDCEVEDPGGGAITGFAIAGADRTYQPAEASHLVTGEDDRGNPRFDRTRIVLRSPLVPEPTHYRYAWGRNPLANLRRTRNSDLPVATQKSDDWALGTWPVGVLDGEIDGALTREQRNVVRDRLRSVDRERRLEEAATRLRGHGYGVRAPAPSQGAGRDR